MRKERERESGARREPLDRLKRLYLREFASISDDIYYSIIFEKDYPALARIFESASLEGVGDFRALGTRLAVLGGDLSLNLRLGQGRASPADISHISAQDIDRIMRYATKREQMSVALCENILTVNCCADTIDLVSDISLKKRARCELFARILNS